MSNFRRPQLNLDVSSPEAVVNVLREAALQYEISGDEIANNPHDGRSYRAWFEMAKALESCAQEISNLLGS